MTLLTHRAQLEINRLERRTLDGREYAVAPMVALVAGVAAVGHGSPDGHPAAKALARAGAPGAAAALREAAARRGAPPGPAVD